ncbi:immunoglobulin-like domain-containing protein [Anaerolentibacter hominis]|uniref:immunoglobulin-like domain-containing protein n=1 Tax=Anaerolentibacter hominis TaxID=3079009 RepID=UPI0031B7F1F8
MKKTKVISVFILFMVFISSCSVSYNQPGEASLPEPDPDLLGRLQQTFDMALQSYDKSHPLDVSYPVKEESRYRYPLSGSFSEEAYGILSQNIAMLPIQYEEASGLYILPVFSLNKEREQWIKETILSDAVFSHSDFQIRQIPESGIQYPLYVRQNPPSPALMSLYEGLRRYESEHPGAVSLAWNGPVRIQTFGLDGVDEISAYINDAPDHCTLAVCYMNEEMERWLSETICNPGKDFSYECLGIPGIASSIADPDLHLEISDIPADAAGNPNISCQTDKQVYSIEDKEIILYLKNQTSNTYNYSREIILDYRNDGSWYRVPRRFANVEYETSKTFILYPLEGNKRQTFYLNLAEYARLVPGTYRVSKHFFGEETVSIVVNFQ